MKPISVIDRRAKTRTKRIKKALFAGLVTWLFIGGVIGITNREPAQTITQDYSCTTDADCDACGADCMAE